MNVEQERLKDLLWRKWGPYVSNRQWGTIREDYSADGDAWNYTTHDTARSIAYRWGEEGIAGISDDRQLVCVSLALWNKKDTIIKEVFYGLSNPEGNHGEDVKELFFYIDNTPAHSYMKMLYKYPQSAYPYEQLKQENKRRTKNDAEFEILDTGIFEKDQYFDVFVEYAKASPEDILIKITVNNRGDEEAAINILPTIWFRNTWQWQADTGKPLLYASGPTTIRLQHNELNMQWLYFDPCREILFCDNETNTKRLYDSISKNKFYKDGINDYLVHQQHTINPDLSGTKAAINYDVTIPGKQSQTFRLRLTSQSIEPFADFEMIFESRIREANEFYADVQKDVASEELKNIQRQAFAGLLWNKQFYYYNVQQWLDGDAGTPAPSGDRKNGRNHQWTHLNNADIISMPDKWEFPWYAAWDLSFQCITLAIIDIGFARQQLLLLMKEWVMHPTGRLPAYEWSFNDVNPPVQAWAVWEVYQAGKTWHEDKGNTEFLESAFHKLLINFTWWINREDMKGNNIFEGGFLGLDNISVFDRNTPLPDGEFIEQADGSSWMAMFALNMMHIALELSCTNKSYIDMANKFFDHFLFIAGAISSIGDENKGLWDEEEEFFYDQLHYDNNKAIRLKVRSMVCLVPLFAVEILDKELLDQHPEFALGAQQFLKSRPDLSSLVSYWDQYGKDEKRLLSLLRGHRMKRLLSRMLDQDEFLSPHGIRSLSKYHEQHPYYFQTNTETLSVRYTPAESDNSMFGGNSNWRGPVWIPMNFLIIKSLLRFHSYYGEDFKVEFPAHSGQYSTLQEIAGQLSSHLISLFTKDEFGKRAVYGSNDKLQTDPWFNEYVLFYEYYHGENGYGLGASHHTGWAALIANLIQKNLDKIE